MKIEVIAGKTDKNKDYSLPVAREVIVKIDGKEMTPYIDHFSLKLQGNRVAEWEMGFGHLCTSPLEKGDCVEGKLPSKVVVDGKVSSYKKGGD